MKHTLVALVENQPGVLQRVANLFSRRGFNIESLTVGTTDTDKISRMTIVVDGVNTQVEQVIKQLYKLIDVLRVSDVTEDRTRRPRAGPDQGARDQLQQPGRDQAAGGHLPRARSSTWATTP